MTKKLLAFVCVVNVAGIVFAQATPDKPAAAQPASPAMQAIQTATSLAKYGYANYSASALIEAAEIMAQTQTQALNTAMETDGKASTGKKTEKPEFTPQNLLADAKKFAKGDATMLAWAEKVEKSLGGKKRGAAGGPRYDISAVNAKSSINCVLAFTAGRLAEIGVSGDGDTDLDLYVYDQNGNLVAYSEDYSDDCYVSWVPRWTGNYVIKVVNRGNVYNRFVIATN